jgi:integrase
MQGHERLFPDLEYSESNGYGNSTGKALNKLLKNKCNIDKSFHCLRHSFATQLKYCHAQPLVVKELTGHKFTDITFGHYGEHFPIATLKEELEKLQYDLDWEHIKNEAKRILHL